MFKNIVPILLVLAALAGTGIGACASAYTISGCNERAIDLMADYPTYEFVGLDYRTSVIDEGDKTFLVYPVTGAKIAEVTDNGNGVFTFTPISKNKVTLYFLIEKNGIIYTRYVIISVLSNCPQEEPCECYPNDPNNNIVINTPTIGETVPVSWSVPNMNGDWSLDLFEDGTLNRGPWGGLYPIEVVATELIPDTDIPTGYVISDCLCG